MATQPNFKYIKNPNKEEFKMVSAAIEENEGYCCCALEKNEDTKCMCAEFRNSEECDFCHCRRFYKVRDCEIIALVVDISDEAGADMFQSWFERLERENFIVLPVVHNTYNWPHSTEQHRNLCKTKIAKSDAVIIINVEGEDEVFMETIEEWARDIDKKVLHREDLV